MATKLPRVLALVTLIHAGSRWIAGEEFDYQGTEEQLADDVAAGVVDLVETAGAKSDTPNAGLRKEVAELKAQLKGVGDDVKLLTEERDKLRGDLAEATALINEIMGTLGVPLNGEADPVGLILDLQAQAKLSAAPAPEGDTTAPEETGGGKSK